MTERQRKIYGGLAAAAIGDAMGAVTEHTARHLIKERYGTVKTFIEPHARLKQSGHIAGQVTDDFSVAYYSLQPMLEQHQRFSTELAVEGLIRWNSIPKYAQCMGPTTRVAMNRYRGIPVPPSKDDHLICINTRVTNGGGMKSGIVGLMNPSDIDGAIQETLTFCGITHNNTLAMSAACAISAATAKAFDPNTSYLDLIRAGLYGADEGLRLAKKHGLHPTAGCSISRKLGLSVEIGLRYQGDLERAMIEIGDLVGCGLYAYESIPAAFGYIAAAKGRPMESLYMAVNAGDDTDTVACMLGYVVGAFGSIDQLPMELVHRVNEANEFNLAQTALDMDTLISGG